MMNLSIVVPVYNEQFNIDKLIEEIKTNVQDLVSNFEVIIVDDGSDDKTWAKIIDNCRKDERITAIKFSRNFGHHYAITAGLHNALGDLVVVMDGDMQDRPEVIPELYKEIQKGFDVVFVNRTNRPESFLYKVAQKFFYLTLRVLSGYDFDSRQANFSIINRKVVEAFKQFPENSRFYGSTIKWLGFRSSSISATHGKRFEGKPSYTLQKRFKLAADIILAFSDRPLKIAIGLGLTMSTLSIFIVTWILIGVSSWGFSVVGWPSLIAAIFFSTGIILVILGILGVYLGQVFKEVKNRPLYLISDTINRKETF
jgi:glycosyltransferase involved in cell wall biosynthesis